MRGVVADGTGGVMIAEVQRPAVLRDTDAVVRVTHAAICGTDLGLLRTGSLARGTVLGHELVGIVDSVGSAVRAIAPGDRVVVNDYTSCGICWWCRSGDHWHCAQRQFFGTGDAFGPTLAGAQTEFVRVPFADVAAFRVPAEVADADAVLLGDLVPTGWAALRRAELTPGEVVAVSGGGPVGQVASVVAQAQGAGPVVVSEPSDARRRIATAGGAHAAAPDDAGQLVASLTDGRGADVVIDCVGGSVGLAAAAALVRPRGRIVSIGVPHHAVWEAPAMDLFTREVTVSFAVGNGIRDHDAYLPLVVAGLLRPGSVVSATVDLAEAPDAYRRAAELVELKVMIAL